MLFHPTTADDSNKGGYEAVNAEEEPYLAMDTEVEKKTVIVHASFLKLGEINTLKEQYDADVLLRLKWREPYFDSWTDLDESKVNWDKLWNPMVFINNKVGEPKITTSKSVEKENGKAYVVERRRLKGSFNETLELAQFPFDVQDLSINVICEYQATEVQLVEDPDEIHKVYKGSFIDEQEWYLYKLVESSTGVIQKDQADPHDQRSVVVVKIRAARRPEYFIWNMFSVTFLICCLSFVTFAVNEKKTENRLQLTFTLVLTGVAFKFVVNQSLPRISYLTYMDRYILATMVVLFCTCIWHGIMPFIGPKLKENADNIAMVVFIGCYLVYNIQFLLRILLVPYKKRRAVRKLEAEYKKRVAEEASVRASIRRAKSLEQVRKGRTPEQKESPKDEVIEMGESTKQDEAGKESLRKKFLYSDK